MSNVRGKSIDNTHLSIDLAEDRNLIHRDYIAHCLRWTHVAKYLHQSGHYKTARLLDIGCGVDVPLARMLYSNRLLIPEYIGVDYNRHDKFKLDMFANGKWKPNTFGRVDFASDQVWFDKAADGQNLLNIRGDNGEDYFTMPNIVTCFEVIEHIEPAHVRALFAKVHKMLTLCKEQGQHVRFFLSTPNWDVVHTADNHVNEMKNEALGAMIEASGFRIAEQYGTFASQSDYKHKFFDQYADGAKLYNQLSKWYDSNYLATILAPLFPREARNCFWSLELRDESDPFLYDHIFKVSEPWSSSTYWRDMDPKSADEASAYDPTKTAA